jgi:UDP-N-acetylglucosamine diphosphorylase / glucose-1-phosphate thymidylyltransferase / UDP-N-acetylgalactosamine diphosphorylase / glucosamine-1-phosphate N-acetyltransferase / galactosamine-1-phosphate N-acetyltransferase
LQPLADTDSTISLIKVFGQPLIVRNIDTATKALKIVKIMMPKDFADSLRLVQDEFPSINVEEFDDDGNFPITDNITKIEAKEISKNDNFEIPINSLVSYSQNNNAFSVEPIRYPWDLLNIVKKLLQDQVRDSYISPTATIAKSSIIDGPCIIEDNVTIDDFCKIKGPVYIGRNSFVGMGSLVRSSMLNNETSIGFNCEIAKTYFGGNDKIAHHNVILDSIIGRNVWFGGYTGTANVLLTRKNVKYMINGNLADTGTHQFGAVVGDNCAVGASVIILPGREVPANTQIQAGTIFGKNN